MISTGSHLPHFEHILFEVEKDTGVAHLKLNRPDKLNALNRALLTEIKEAIFLVKREDHIKGVLLSGEGKAFCAGADISELAGLNAQTGLAFAKYGQMVFNQLENCTKPIVAAIQGVAMGGGCELAMAATLRIATEKSKFAQPESKLGVIPGFGGTQRLARLIGKGRALAVCLSAKSILAEEALAWGLVNEIVSEDQLLGRAKAVLMGILEQGTQATRSIIEAIHQGYNLPLKEALQIEALHFALCCSTEEKQEGVAAFLEKRKAQFNQRKINDA